MNPKFLNLLQTEVLEYSKWKSQHVKYLYNSKTEICMKWIEWYWLDFLCKSLTKMDVFQPIFIDSFIGFMRSKANFLRCDSQKKNIVKQKKKKKVVMVLKGYLSKTTDFFLGV